MKGDQLLLSAAAVGGRDGGATAITARTIARDFARAIEAYSATEVDLSQIIKYSMHMQELRTRPLAHEDPTQPSAYSAHGRKIRRRASKGALPPSSGRWVRRSGIAPKPEFLGGQLGSKRWQPVSKVDRTARTATWANTAQNLQNWVLPTGPAEPKFRTWPESQDA